MLLRTHSAVCGPLSRHFAGGDHEIAQPEEDLQLMVVFLQAPVACLAMSEEILEDVERMFDKRPHRGFRFFSSASRPSFSGPSSIFLIGWRLFAICQSIFPSRMSRPRSSPMGGRPRLPSG